MEQKGSMLLKVASIIMIVGGIASAVISLILALVAAAATAVVSSSDAQAVLQQADISAQQSGGIMALIWIGVIIVIAGAVIEIIAGFKGKANWNNPAQAKSLMILGIACAAVSLLGNILFSVGSHTAQIVSILGGLVIPVLYIIGTIQLKNQE